MISAIATQHRHVSENQPKAGKPETGDGFAPGKSADSVGHRAKATVIETGDVEPGAQGRAASLINRMDVTALSSTLPPVNEPPAAA